MKIYDVPHKGLRNALSQLSLLAGKTNYSNHAEVKQLWELGKDVFSILSIHTTDEDQVTLAQLEKRSAGCSQHDMDDHQHLHIAQEKLEILLSKIYSGVIEGKDVNADAAEFYLLLSEYHGTYLEHTAEEERVTQPLLWKHFTDEELALHRKEIMSKNSPQILLVWFRFVIPAQSHTERVGLLTGFKKMAAADFFEEGMKVIKNVLSEKEFEELNNAL